MSEILNQTVSTAGNLVNRVDQPLQIVELSSLSNSSKREILRRVNGEVRQKIKDYLTSKEVEKYLKNTYVDSEGELCFIKLEQTSGPNVQFENFWNNFGMNKLYDPTIKQQRRDKQHKEHDRKEILLSFIAGENLGNLILLESEDGRYWVIDGRQRSSILNEFFNNQLSLSGPQANNFWKWFLNDQFLYSETLHGEDKEKSNKIISQLSKGKTPKVVFGALPSNIQNYIHKTFSIQTVIIRPVVFKLSPSYKKVDHSKWDMEEVMSSITRKFIDINMYHKAIDKKDIIWGAKSESIMLVREFLEDKPVVGLRFGFNLIDKIENNVPRLDDTNEVRTLLFLLAKACMIFQGTVKWAASQDQITKLILKSDDHDFESKTKQIWRAWKTIVNNNLFTKPYFENGKEKTLFIPEEFKQGQRDVLVLSYILVTLYLVDYLLEDGYGVKNGYFFNQQPSTKLYKLLEKISIYLIFGKIANVDDKPEPEELELLKKYDLVSEYTSKEIFEGETISELMRKVKNLGKHQKGLASGFENTFRKLIRYSESKI